MQLTRFTDFTLRTLIYLAIQPEGNKVPLHEIAEHFNMPRNHLIRISQKLSKLGYVKSARGINGGITLSKNPADINVGVVVRQTEKQLTPINCSELECPLVSKCRLERILDEAKQAFLAELDRYTLVDLVSSKRNIRTLLQVDISA